MSNEPDYRPRSPDLSAFAPPPAPPLLARLPSYHYQEPGPPAGYSAHHRGSYDASPYFSPATAQSNSYFTSQPHAEPLTYSSPTTSDFQTQSSAAFNDNFASSHHVLPLQRVPAQVSQYLLDNQLPPPVQPSHHQPPPPFSNFSRPQYYSSPTDMARPRRGRKSSADEDDNSEDASYNPNSIAPSSRAAKKQKSNALAPTNPMAPTPPTNPFADIEVKTKFPVARIKRIMQADEDVGKVAQATPTAVSKALELFMIQLVQKGAAEARARGSKKVTAAHLKSALMQDEQFDFLNGICDKVPDPSEKKRGGANAKSEGEGEGEGEDSSDQNAKKVKGKRRGTKVADDSD